jgi:hypothetical protein
VRKPRAKAVPARRSKSVLLAGGNPQIAKGDGDAPVREYLAALPGWKREMAERIDELIVSSVPKLQKAVKWNSPLYGAGDGGWFLGMHAFTHYLKLAFFRGRSLRPMPPGASKNPETRYLDVREGDELDEAQLVEWLKQASALPGVNP